MWCKRAGYNTAQDIQSEDKRLKTKEKEDGYTERKAKWVYKVLNLPRVLPNF
jgi:hypothetical protein